MSRSMRKCNSGWNNFVLSGVLIGLAAGCSGGGSSNPDAAIADGPPVLEAAVATEALGPASLFCTSKPALPSVTDLSGTWVARLVGSQNVNAPVVGPLKIQTKYYLLVNIVQSGTQVVVDGRYCDRIESDPPTSLAPVTIPNAWAHTETIVHRIGTFAAGSDGIPVLSLPDTMEVAGAELVSPSDLLPTLLTDQRVVDSDNDGQPGLTIRIGGMISSNMYVVQRQTTSMLAIPVGTDRVEGALTFASTQKVLDPPAIVSLYKDAVAGPDPVLCNSTVVMVRVAGVPGSDRGSADDAGIDGGVLGDGGSVPLGCAWVREQEATLFPTP